jgi:hypothetical protein
MKNKITVVKETTETTETAENRCKCIYKMYNDCPDSKECKGIPRKGCPYAETFNVKLECLNDFLSDH